MRNTEDLLYDDFSIYIPEKTLAQKLHDLELWKMVAEMQGIDTTTTVQLINELQHQIKNQTVHNILSDL